MQSGASQAHVKWNEDGFGLLPVEFRPGFLDRLLGTCGFTVRPDKLVVEVADGQLCIAYHDISSAISNGRLLAIESENAESFGKWKFKARSAAEADRYASLIQRLSAESKRYVFLQNAPEGVSRLGNLIGECLEWRGQPFVAAADVLLREVVHAGATDVHLEPLPQGVRVTVRRSRELVEAGTYALNGHEGLCSRLKYLAGCHSHRSGIIQEGAWSMADATGEARLSIYPAIDGERVAIRFIRPIAFPDLPSLGWASETVTSWRTLLARGPGLVLIAGPVGSGKTTALYATLAELAGLGGSQLRRVATIEDPVEGRVPGICQSSLSSESGSSLDAAFKHLLRQDPDVMALGEIRDAACLREALQAGQAGHLVLATFHAANAAGAIERLRKLGLDQGLVNASLKGILSVRLEKGLKPVADIWQSDAGLAS